jgi:hypothetical protein
MRDTKNWVPEIMYEDAEDGLTSKIPFIMVPKEEEMPKLLFMFESRETGEYEPGPEGEQLPIIDMELHQYADMVYLKQGLTPELYDQVRLCLGLKPLSTAVVEGKEITDRIREKITNQ